MLGPVVGFAGAHKADRGLSVLLGETGAFGSLVSFDGKTDRAREFKLAARARCALCGTERSIDRITYDRYTAASCAA